MKLHEILKNVGFSWAPVSDRTEQEREALVVCSLLNIQWDEGEHLIGIMRSATSRYVEEYPISFATVWGRNWDIAKTMMMEGQWNFHYWTVRCGLTDYL